jgi:hypothetical protein
MELTAVEIAYCVAVLLVSYSLRGSGGFGGVIGLPLLAIVIPLKIVAPAWTLLGIASSLAILGRDRQHVAKRELVGFLPWCVLGVAIGAYLFDVLEAAALARTLGVLILVYAAYSLWLTTSPQMRDPVPAGVRRPVAATLSGAVGTLLGATATIFFAIYLGAQTLEKRAFRATMSAMLLALSVLRAVAYIAVDEFSDEAVVLFVAALPAMGLGIYIGGRIHARLSEIAFRRLVCGILVVCAIPLLLK